MSDHGDGQPMFEARSVGELQGLRSHLGETEDVKVRSVRSELDDFEIGFERWDPGAAGRRPGNRQDHSVAPATPTSQDHLDLVAATLLNGSGNGVHDLRRFLDPGIDHQTTDEVRGHEVGERPDDGVEGQIDAHEVVYGETSDGPIGGHDMVGAHWGSVHGLTIGPESTLLPVAKVPTRSIRDLRPRWTPTVHVETAEVEYLPL